jgi:hypothetical protein
MRNVLLTILIALFAKMGISAEEIFNKLIVETFSETIGRSEYHHAGVDITDDGFTDLFITVPYVNRDPFLRRLANLLREGARVSFDDSNKLFDRDMRINTLDSEYILEVNGRSVLQIFPGEDRNFPAEAARQRLLREQSSVPQSHVSKDKSVIAYPPKFEAILAKARDRLDKVRGA